MVPDLEPSEIEAPLTPGTSHGTKIFVSKFSSYYPLMMLHILCVLLIEVAKIGEKQEKRAIFTKSLTNGQ